MSATFRGEPWCKFRKHSLSLQEQGVSHLHSETRGLAPTGTETGEQEPGWGSLEVLLATASVSQVSFLQPHEL